MNVAFITSGNPYNRKGFFNNVHERVFGLKNENISYITIDVYIVTLSHTRLFSLIKKRQKEKEIPSIEIDDITYKILWTRFSLYDYLLTQRLKFKSIFGKNHIKKHREIIKKYDLIMAHGQEANYLAYATFLKYKTPYIASWHGSEINVSAFRNKYTFTLFKDIFEKAYTNLFVSKALLEKSNEITTLGKKEVFYTGPANLFYQYKPEKIKKLKSKYNVGEQKIIGFIGNFVPVKNIKTLPKIFEKLNKYDSSIQFWIIGNGELETQLRNGVEEFAANCHFFGKLEPKDIPDLLNCMDILVLPSLNEGLPRVCLEALACGVNVVGSDVGGIPEVIGKENVFALDNNFIDKVSNRVIEIIENKEKPNRLSNKFSNKKSLNRLLEIIDETKRDK